MEDFDSIVLPSHGNPIVIQWLKQGKAKVMPSGCWEWQRGGDAYGYGTFRSGSKMLKAHRVAINANCGQCSLHSCDNRKCINPSHLRTGSVEDNNDDKMKRGRGIKENKRAYGTCYCGRAGMLRYPSKCTRCYSIESGKACHCGSPAFAKNMCAKHYQQQWKMEKSND